VQRVYASAADAADIDVSVPKDVRWRDVSQLPNRRKCAYVAV
jgi:hypothetical protein